MNDWLAAQFEENRAHLRAVAYRMLGSMNEAEEAVQESWIRLIRSDTASIENLSGWLTTVVARVCLDMLRSRETLREEPITNAPIVHRQDGVDPEHEALQADSVCLALFVVLETLTPAERLALVLHDMFAVPFDEIAPHRRPLPGRGQAARQSRAPAGAGLAGDARHRPQPPNDPATVLMGTAAEVRGPAALAD